MVRVARAVKIVRTPDDTGVGTGHSGGRPNGGTEAGTVVTGGPVAETEHDLHVMHKNLTQALREQHARVLAAEPEGPTTEDDYRALVERAETLLAFEARLPARLAEPQRRRGARVVFWSWRVQSAVAAGLIVAAHLLGHSGWWLLLILPHLAGTLAGWSLKVPAGQHATRRWGALALHVVGALLVLLVLGVITAWFLIAVAVGWFVVGVLCLDETGDKK